MDRRRFLKASGLMACSVAAHPALTTMTLASAPTDHRLVVLILRGGMDGVDVVQPYADPALASARPSLEVGPENGAFDLDGRFSLNPIFEDLVPLWRAGELAFAHAVSTPYRDERSHFDGQDLLEAGTGPDVTGPLARQGWLNRMLQVLPGATAETAFAIGRDELRVLNGAADVRNWAPSTRLDLSPQSRLLLSEIYHDAPLFRDAADEAMDLAEALDMSRESGSYGATMNAMEETVAGVRRGEAAEDLARFAADRLLDDTRVAAFSINGWDTHQSQARGLRRAGKELTAALMALRSGLGATWDKTLVLAVTEFGRTVRENGNRGTDHGTGGAMFLAGGALARARVYGDWPGLDEASLYDRRDLMPTADVRAYAAWAMRGLFGLGQSDLERTVFPGLDMGGDPGFLA